VEGSSNIAKPITTLHCKGINYEWNVGSDIAFIELKTLITSVLILQVPNMDKYFTLCMDSSKKVLGVFLMQDGGVMAYVSWKLKHCEEIYVTRDLELASMMLDLKVWRHYIVR
jgi:hypothetical protein